jgi:hypothetical protein
MPNDISEDIQNEAELVRRFAGSYRQTLAGLITALNQAKSAADAGRAEARSMRSCVEAVDFVLASHAEFAKSLSRLAKAA